MQNIYNIQNDNIFLSLFLLQKIKQKQMSEA